jgi:hypothetical protein
MDDETLKKTYIAWLEYWHMAITSQHNDDKAARVGAGAGDSHPLYKDDTDRAINGIIVAALLDRIDGLWEQFARSK